MFWQGREAVGGVIDFSLYIIYNSHICPVYQL
jgi:hypothetical protein